MGLWGLLVILITFPIIIKIIHCIMVWMRFIALRFCEPQVTCIEQTEIPSLLGPVFEEADHIMANLGFVYSHAQKSMDIMANNRRPTYIQVYFHAATSTYAEAYPSVSPDGRQAISIEFITYLEHEEVFITVNNLKHLLLPQPSSLHFDDYYVKTVDEQWEHHQDTLKEHDSPRQRFTDETYATQVYLSHKKALQHLIEQKWLVSLPAKGQWRFKAGAALRVALKALKEIQKQAMAAKTRGGNILQSCENDAAVVAANVEAFKRQQETEQGLRHTALAKCVFFIISILLFALAFGFLNDWLIVPIIIGILLLHEVGHLAAMKFFGYRDPKMLFIPFVGAAAVGVKDSATPGQRFIVSLMGPLPGLVIGGVCLATALHFDYNWLQETAILLLVINYFNLLPVLPMDGGRIVEQLFLSRFPRARFFLALLSTVILILAYFGFHAPIFLILALLFGLSLRSKWQTSMLARRLHRAIPPDADEDLRLRAIFFELTHAGYAQMKASSRMQSAKVLNAQLNIPSSKKTTMIFGSLIYLTLLLSPVIIPVFMLTKALGIDGVHALVSEKYRQEWFASMTNEPDWDIQIQKSENNDERWDIWMKATYWNAANDNQIKARDYLERVQHITAAFPTNDHRRISVILLDAQLTENMDAQGALCLDAIGLAEHIYGTNAVETANVLYQAGILNCAYFSIQEQINMLQRALGIHETTPDPDIWACSDLLQEIAMRYETAGDYEKAEQALEKELLLCLQDNELTLPTAEELIAYYVRNENMQQARTVLDFAQNNSPSYESYRLAELFSQMGWLYMEADDEISARQCFREALQIVKNDPDEEHYSKAAYSSGYLLDLAYLEQNNENSRAMNTLFRKIQEVLQQGPGFEALFITTQEDLIDANEDYDIPQWILRRDSVRAEMITLYKRYIKQASGA